MSTLHQSLLDEGVRGHIYFDKTSNDAPYKVRDIVRGRTCNGNPAIVVQYEKGSAELLLETHLEDLKVPQDIVKRLGEEGKFKLEDFKPIIM